MKDQYGTTIFEAVDCTTVYDLNEICEKGNTQYTKRFDGYCINLDTVRVYSRKFSPVPQKVGKSDSGYVFGDLYYTRKELKMLVDNYKEYMKREDEKKFLSQRGLVSPMNCEKEIYVIKVDGEPDLSVFYRSIDDALSAIKERQFDDNKFEERYTIYKLDFYFKMHYQTYAQGEYKH